MPLFIISLEKTYKLSSLFHTVLITDSSDRSTSALAILVFKKMPQQKCYRTERLWLAQPGPGGLVICLNGREPQTHKINKTWAGRLIWLPGSSDHTNTPLYRKSCFSVWCTTHCSLFKIWFTNGFIKRIHLHFGHLAKRNSKHFFSILSRVTCNNLHLSKRVKQQFIADRMVWIDKNKLSGLLG